MPTTSSPSAAVASAEKDLLVRRTGPTGEILEQPLGFGQDGGRRLRLFFGRLDGSVEFLSIHPGKVQVPAPVFPGYSIDPGRVRECRAARRRIDGLRRNERRNQTADDPRPEPRFRIFSAKALLNSFRRRLTSALSSPDDTTSLSSIASVNICCSNGARTKSNFPDIEGGRAPPNIGIALGIVTTKVPVGGLVVRAVLPGDIRA